MSEKVILPREVAEAIESLREEGVSNYGIMHRAKGALFSKDDLTIKRWAFDNEGGTPDILMSALINGYEVENELLTKFKSHYDIVEFYEGKALDTSERNQVRYSCGFVNGVQTTLNLLGITIEGIND